MVILIFDGHCGFCTSCVQWVRARDPEGRVRLLPGQKPGVLAEYGLTQDEADKEAWAIAEDGGRFAGAAAINRVLAEIGGVWGVIGGLYRVWPISWIEDRVYRWVATHRRTFWLFAVIPECERPGGDCL